MAGLGTGAGGWELTAPLLGAHCEGRAVFSTGRVRMEGGESPKSERVKEKQAAAGQGMGSAPKGAPTLPDLEDARLAFDLALTL